VLSKSVLRCLFVACVLVSACGKDDKAAGSERPRLSLTADAPAVEEAVPGDAPGRTDDAAPTVTATAATAKVLEVVLADRVACARRTDGRVRCWGSPFDGRGLPVVASAIEIPDLTTAASIDLGPDQTLYVVTEDGHVRSVTLDLRAKIQLAELEGIDDVVEVRANGKVPVVLTRTGNVFTPTSASPILTNAVALRRALDGSVQVLHRDGRVSWFDGKAREVPKLTDATGLFGNRCAERRTGARVCWDSGKVKPWAGAANIIDRVHGQRFRCDLTGSGVACAGANDSGQLGAGPGPDRGEARSVNLPAKPIALAAGPRSVCAVLDSGELACWGANDGGQLGDGTLIDRPTPILVPGLTSAAPPAPSDGRANVQEASTPMDWSGLPAGCKRPMAISTGEAKLATIASAYAHVEPRGTMMWLADFALPPDGFPAGVRPVRGTQLALQLALSNGKKPVDRGRYQDRGQRVAQLTIHAGERTPQVVDRVDLVVELVDKTWICGQLLDVADPKRRQPFAARIHKRTR